MATKSEIKLDLMPNQVKALNINSMTNKITENDLKSFGISMDSAIMPEIGQYYGFAFDAAPALQTKATITNPVQFFQYFAPEAIEVVTAARTIDNIVGRTIAGSFEDEEVVTKIVERTGGAKPYTDTANIPFTSYNTNFEKRTICRFEDGLQVGYLESLRASRMQIDDHKEKMAAVGETLAIAHNDVGFYGYTNGANNTYGLLNDPNLPAYVTVAAENGNYTWATKTYAGIVSDIITAVAALSTNLKALFKPTKDAFTLVIPNACSQYLNKLNALGTKSVSTWFAETYPNARIEVAPEFDGANGGVNVFYVFVDKVNGKDTFKQYIQDVLRLIGVEKKAKVLVESYASATAGVLCQYPIAIVRYTGI